MSNYGEVCGNQPESLEVTLEIENMARTFYPQVREQFFNNNYVHVTEVLSYTFEEVNGTIYKIRIRADGLNLELDIYEDPSSFLTLNGITRVVSQMMCG